MRMDQDTRSRQLRRALSVQETERPYETWWEQERDRRRIVIDNMFTQALAFDIWHKDMKRKYGRSRYEIELANVID